MVSTSTNQARNSDEQSNALKAIARDPLGRYQTAGAFSTDLQRYLEGRAITGRRASASEQIWRSAKRHPTISLLIQAVIAVSTIGTIVASLYAYQAEVQRAMAQAREREAVAARQQATLAQSEAEVARDAAQRQVVKFDILTAAKYAERNEPELALHWVSRAWQDDEGRLLPSEKLEDMIRPSRSLFGCAEESGRLRKQKYVRVLVDTVDCGGASADSSSPTSWHADARCRPRGFIASWRHAGRQQSLHTSPKTAEGHHARVVRPSTSLLVVPPLRQLA